MTMSEDLRRELGTLEHRLRTILPEEYQGAYEDIQPVSMGSAALKFDAEGRVAWNEIWGSFCDLAMAGGPPHKGTLLEPGSEADLASDPDRYEQVVDEICRGITLATELPAEPSPVPGWVRVTCLNQTMADWLLRAIVMENVAVQAEDNTVDLPAAPQFRLEKEIKNVVTVIAKTCHYWLGHMPRAQQRAIDHLFETMAGDLPLIAPTRSPYDRQLRDHMAEQIRRDVGLNTSSHRYHGWLGVQCPSVGAAVWLMRALVVSNVLSRREERTLFLPIHPARDPGGHAAARRLTRVHDLAKARAVV